MGWSDRFLSSVSFGIPCAPMVARPFRSCSSVDTGFAHPMLQLSFVGVPHAGSSDYLSKGSSFRICSVRVWSGSSSRDTTPHTMSRLTPK